MLTVVGQASSHLSSTLSSLSPSKAVTIGAVTLGVRWSLAVRPSSFSRIRASYTASMSGSEKAKEQPEGMEHEAAILAELAKVPSITAAWVNPTADAGNIITAQFAQRDIAGNKVRKFVRSLHLPKVWDREIIKVHASFPTELQNTLLHSVSPSGKYQLLVKADNDNSVLELWSESKIEKTIHVPKTIHGKVYAENWFGLGVAWSEDEKRIAYVAETGFQERTPEWGLSGKIGKQKSDASSTAPPGKAGPKGWHGHGESQEDWGELHTGKKVPQLFVLELEEESVVPVPGLPQDCSSGQPIWTPDGKGLVFVAWPHQSTNFPNLTQRLGIVYCVNRPCFLYHIPDLATEAVASRIDTGFQSNLCPQFAPDGKHLYFLSYDCAVQSGAHFSTASLPRLSWPPSGKAQVLVDVVQNSDQDEFPGLYCPALKASQLGFIDNDRFLLSSVWRSSITVLDIKIAEAGGKAEVARSGGLKDGWTSIQVLTVKHGIAVAVCSAPNQPPCLAVAKTTDPGGLHWHRLHLQQASYCSPVADAFSSERESHQIVQCKSSSGGGSFEAVLLLNTDGGKKAPTILVPHGGPHSVFPASFLMSNLFFNLLGYNVLQVNYRGSIGFGEELLQSLPGMVGTNDVQDCMDALDQAISEGWVDREKVAVIGGSHGGFLTGHLLGQHADRFKAGVLRNPVLDIALMTQISDIPDWCFIEGFGSQAGLEKARVKPTQDDLHHLTAISPISHIDQVKAPMFFMLGAKDRRVAMKDAQQYVAAMRARKDGPATRVIVFPEDTHALDKPQTEFEQWVNAAWWVKQHIGDSL